MQNSPAPPQQPGYPQQGYPQPEHPQPGNPQEGYPAQNYGQPQMTSPTPVEGPREGCCSLNQKNKPQGYAIGAAGLIFMSGGMNIAWAVGFQGPIGYSTTYHNFIAWFIGVIIGAVITCGLTLVRVPKKWVLLFASLLVTIGGLVIACTHHNGSATIAACYLDGIANGLVFGPFMALAAELSVAYKRGIYASMEQLSLGIGILLQFVNFISFNYVDYNYSFTYENMKGVLSTILGFLALILGSFMTIESPVLMLANDEETGVINALRRICQAVPTCLRLGYLGVLNAISLSSFLFCTEVLYINLYEEEMKATGWIIAFVICRLLGTVFTSFCSDCLGRKKPTLLGLLLAAGMAFAIYNRTSSVTVLLLLFAFFAGVAFTPSSAYISEAYPLAVKQHFISFTFVVEMFVFYIFNFIIFLIFVNLEQESDFFYIMGGMYLGGFILSYISFPETKPLTMRGPQEQFSRFLKRVFNSRKKNALEFIEK